MIALDARRLAGAAPLDYETLDAPACEVHRQAQADRAATDDQYFDLTGLAHTRITHSCITRESDTGISAFPPDAFGLRISVIGGTMAKWNASNRSWERDETLLRCQQ